MKTPVGLLLTLAALLSLASSSVDARQDAGARCKAPRCLNLSTDRNQVSVAEGSIVDVYEFNARKNKYRRVFTSKPIEPTPLSVVSRILVADVDNDGEKEIVTIVHRLECGPFGFGGYCAHEYVLQIYDNGSRGKPTWQSDPLNYGRGVRGLAVGDADTDGLAEIVITPSDQSVEVWECAPSPFTCQRTWTGMQPSLAHKYVERVDIGDANNDGFNDIVVGVSVSIPDAVIWVFEGNAAGTWTAKATEPAGGKFAPVDIYAVKVRDLDGDGVNEIIGAITDWSDGPFGGGTFEFGSRWGIWRVDNAGEYRLSWRSPEVRPGTLTFSLDAADLDGDGVDEVLMMGGPGRCTARLYKNSGGVYSEVMTLRSRGCFVTAGDVDNDGRQEFVLTDGRTLRVIGYDSARGFVEEKRVRLSNGSRWGGMISVQ